MMECRRVCVRQGKPQQSINEKRKMYGESEMFDSRKILG